MTRTFLLYFIVNCHFVYFLVCRTKNTIDRPFIHAFPDSGIRLLANVWLELHFKATYCLVLLEDVLMHCNGEWIIIICFPFQLSRKLVGACFFFLIIVCIGFHVMNKMQETTVRLINVVRIGRRRNIHVFLTNLSVLAMTVYLNCCFRNVS